MEKGNRKRLIFYAKHLIQITSNSIRNLHLAIMKNILISLDLKEYSQQLIDKGVELAAKFDSKVWLMHVTDPDPDFVGYEVGPQYLRDLKADDIRTAHKTLQELTEGIRRQNIEAEGLLIQGPTVEMILEEAKKLSVDLLIIGYEKHGFFYKAFVGETSTEIIKESNIPILVVPVATDSR